MVTYTSKNNKINFGFYILLLIPFVVPDYLNHIGVFYYVFKYMLIISMFTILIIYVTNNRISRFIVLLIIFNLVYLISSFTNGVFYTRMLIDISRNISICMLIEYGIMKNDTQNLFKGMTYFLGALSILNLLLFFIFPNGLMLSSRWNSRVNFLSTDNGLPAIILPIMSIILIDSIIQNNKITKSAYFVFSICIFNLLLTWSGTGIAGLLVYIIYLIFVYNKYISKYISIWHCLFVNLIVFLIIVILRRQDVFRFIIENVLQKDLTFTNRLAVWDISIDCIKQLSQDMLSFIFGFGKREVNIILQKTNGLYAHSHNQLLEVVLQSGFIGLLVFIIIIFIVSKKLAKYRDNNIAIVLTATIFAFSIMSISDTCFSNLFFIILAISYHVDKVIACTKKSIGKEDELHSEVIKRGSL